MNRKKGLFRRLTLAPRARTENGSRVRDDVIGPSFLKEPGGFLGKSRDLKSGRRVKEPNWLS